MLSVLACMLLTAPTLAHGDLRVMTPVELVSNSVIIARVRVVDVDESEWRDFRQVATLELMDVIDGDFTLRRINVAAGSLLPFTADWYGKKEEWLVFLFHDAGFYRTVNYQYGQFRIENETVKGWRNQENVASNQPYYSVREDIERILTSIRTPNNGEAVDPNGSTPDAPLPRSPGPEAQPPPRPRSAPPRIIRPDEP